MTGWWAVAFVVLAVVVVVQSALLVALFRLVGVVMMRLGPNYSRAFKELPWGDRAPVERLRSIDGVDVPTRGARTLVTFVSPGCGVCRHLPSALRALRPRYPETRFLVMVEGDATAAGDWARRHRIKGASVFASVDQPRRVSKGIASPYGVVLDADGRVLHHGIVNDREMLEDLLADHAATPEGPHPAVVGAPR